jgi:anaerobic selenocysteine-containing dehydrogenase
MLPDDLHQPNLSKLLSSVSRDLGQEEGNSDAERYLEISPELAKQRGIQSGQWLRVESRWGL